MDMIIYKDSMIMILIYCRNYGRIQDGSLCRMHNLEHATNRLTIYDSNSIAERQRSLPIICKRNNERTV